MAGETTILESLSRTDFPTASQLQRIHDTAKALGYDKVQMTIDTRGSIPQVRYAFLKGRKIVQEELFGLFPRETAELIWAAMDRAGASD